MSGDLISRSALITAVDDIDWYSVNEESGKLMQGAESSVSALFKAGEIYEAMANAPAVDSVEVVRCRSCRNGEYMGHAIYCHHWCKNTDEDGYCHKGVWYEQRFD